MAEPDAIGDDDLICLICDIAFPLGARGADGARTGQPDARYPLGCKRGLGHPAAVAARG